MYNSLQKKDFHIIEKFRYFLIVSLVIILAGAIMLGFKGMNVGIDFTGGTKIEVELDSFAEQTEVKKVIEEKVNEFFTNNGCRVAGAMQSSPSNDGITYEFRLNYYHNGELTTAEQEVEFIGFIQGDLNDDTNNGLCGELQTYLSDLFNSNETLKNAGAVIDDEAIYAYTVGATASSSLLKNAIVALSVAIVIMLIYIVLRFTLSSAFAAICALAHDVLIMIALTVIFQIPVNSVFIAAVITIVGYSINATIVIFDRIREYTKLDSYSSVSDVEIANLSIKKTLNRSIWTTVTTLFMVIPLAIFSVSAIREFVLPIIFGLIAGAYSSVFLASSFWVMFRKIGRKIKSRSTKKA